MTEGLRSMAKWQYIYVSKYLMYQNFIVCYVDIVNESLLRPTIFGESNKRVCNLFKKIILKELRIRILRNYFSSCSCRKFVFPECEKDFGEAYAHNCRCNISENIFNGSIIRAGRRFCVSRHAIVRQRLRALQCNMWKETTKVSGKVGQPKIN